MSRKFFWDNVCNFGRDKRRLFKPKIFRPFLLSGKPRRKFSLKVHWSYLCPCALYWCLWKNVLPAITFCSVLWLNNEERLRERNLLPWVSERLFAIRKTFKKNLYCVLETSFISLKTECEGTFHCLPYFLSSASIFLTHSDYSEDF